MEAKTEAKQGYCGRKDGPNNNECYKEAKGKGGGLDIKSILLSPSADWRRLIMEAETLQ